MSGLRYILASLWHYRRIQLAVAAGAAVATAVITGALLVGDSVRGSLRELALERLGRVETLLVGANPFREALAQEFSAAHAASDPPIDIAPLVITRGTLKASNGNTSRLATNLSVFGCTADFWRLGTGAPEKPLIGTQCAITEQLAKELGAEVGDELLLRIPSASRMPGDSPLGEQDESSVARRLRLAAIFSPAGLARFSLRPSQRNPRNVFLSLAEIQDLLDWQDEVNAIAVSPTAGSSIQYEKLQPTTTDLGLSVEEITLDCTPPATFLQITARGLVLADHVVSVVVEQFAASKPQPVITYLANTLAVGERQIPYSTITGVESTAALGPLVDESNQPIALAENEIVLNTWAATNLHAKVGDEVRITYYEPETTHGQLREGQPLRLTLKAIVPLADTTGKPTRAADPMLTPELPGVTDSRSINDWDLPFELVETIRNEDEQYWDDYRTTPKAFISKTLAERIWKTRWGTVSALRLPGSNEGARKYVEAQLAAHIDPAQLGMQWLPLRRQALRAARGTTSFEGLFLGFSFFLMASAVLLILLLFRLGVEGRVAENGVLRAAGFTPERLRRLLLGEAAIVSVVGAATGVLVGLAYAQLMIHGLTTWWVDAVGTPFLTLHVTPTSLLGGLVIGIVAAVCATAWSLRRTVSLPVWQLLAGDCSIPIENSTKRGGRWRWLPGVFLACAVMVAWFARNLQGEAQAGAFFSSGALVLTALLRWLRTWLHNVRATTPRQFTLAGLASRTSRRNPVRTILSVGLASAASFLIVALSTFRLAPTEHGTGGFDWIATADHPMHFDLNNPAGRGQLGFSDEENQRLKNFEVQSFRVRAGEDASCLNLYQTTRPRVLGVPRSFFGQNRFTWSARVESEEFQDQPWRVLTAKQGNDDHGRPIVPIVLDRNTATYSLHLAGVGAQMTIRDADDQPVTLEVVGLLAGCILQGDVLMSEENFLRLYPAAAGYQMFLIRKNSQQETDGTSVSGLLESRLEDFGFDVANARTRLAEFQAVQNTYLSTFQSLGALGLLLGTFGLAVAQLRSVVERRAELALLRGVGWSRGRLSMLVLGENMVLLAAGLGFGCLAAAAAVLPHWWLGHAEMPWVTLGAMLLTVALAGIFAGGFAMRAAVRAPLLPALRGE